MPDYTQEDLEAAIQEYLETDKSQYQVAQEFGIPRSTLNDNIRMLFGYVDPDMGRRALGLPSVKVAQEKAAVLSGASDVSEETEKTLPDMSGRGKVKVKEGQTKVILIAGLAALVCFVLWQWWQ